MLKRVAEFISRYSMFTRGQSVGVAVSGGADSVCLLYVLLELSTQCALRLKVLHLDHQLRGEESREDAHFVENLARQLGLESAIRQSDVRRLRTVTADNLEQAARNARRDFFLDCMRSGQVDKVALGHTRSDQAETVLFRLLRGSGTTGLTGILPVTTEGFVRPLLDIERPEIEAFLRARGIAWREDSSNRDPQFTRNRIRRQLLPELIRDWNTALPSVLANTAEIARDDESYWNSEMDRLLAAHSVRERAGLVINASDLRRQVPAVGRRLVRRMIQEIKGDLRRVDFNHVEEILRLACAGKGRGSMRIPGVCVARSFDWLRFSLPESLPSDYRVALPAAGSISLPATGWRLESEVSECEGEKEGALDWERLPGPLEIRNWHSGDAYRPAGFARPLKIKHLFQKCRIPAWERPAWPVLVGGDAVLWACRFGPAADYTAEKGARRILKIHAAKELNA